MPATATQPGTSKAQRLADTGAVRYLPAARVYPVVEGDRITLVIFDGPHGHCLHCRDQAKCEHIKAVRLTRERESQPAASVLL